MDSPSLEQRYRAYLLSTWFLLQSEPNDLEAVRFMLGRAKELVDKALGPGDRDQEFWPIARAAIDKALATTPTALPVSP